MQKNQVDRSLEPILEALELVKENKAEIQKLILKANALAETWTDSEFSKYSEDLVEFLNKARNL